MIVLLVWRHVKGVNRTKLKVYVVNRTKNTFPFDVIV
jgi:hypothetical protein